MEKDGLDVKDPAIAAAEKRIADARAQLAGTVKEDEPPKPAATEKPPAPASAVEEPPAVPPEPKEELKDLKPADLPKAGEPEWYKAEVERLTAELNRRDGVHGAALQAKDREIDALKTRIAEFEANPRAADREEVAAAGELTADEARKLLKEAHPGIDYSAYEDDDVILFALPFFKRRESAPTEEVTQLKKSVEQMEAARSYQMFGRAVEAIATGFMAANGDPHSGIPGDPAWAAYLSEPVVAGGPQSIGEWLSQYGDVATTAHHFKIFSERGKAPAAVAPNPEPKKPSAADQVAPDAVVQPAPVTGEPTIYSRSAVEQFRRDITAGRIPWNAENQKLFREYQMADMEGRVR